MQKELKPFFVEKGLMIGEFHMANNMSTKPLTNIQINYFYLIGGLRNPNFYPLRTPYPCLAMRYMVNRYINIYLFKL